MATLRFLWLNWQYYLKPCLCRKSCRSVAALLMKIFQRRWRPQIRVKKSFQLSWCMYFWPYVVCGADNPPRDRGGRFKNPVDVCHTWVTCGLHYSWVIPAWLVMCVILGHEKCKIQDIMDCEKIRGSVRYWVWVKNKILFVHFSNCGFCSNRILPYFPLSVRSSQVWYLTFLKYIKA